MRKIFGILAITGLLLTPVAAQAGVGSFVFGYMIGSSGGHGSATQLNNMPPGTATLYVMARADERVKNPLEVRILTTNSMCFKDSNDRFYDSGSLQGCFNAKIEHPKQYALIAVLWRPYQDGGWLDYLYTDWSNIRPTKQLAPEKK